MTSTDPYAASIDDPGCLRMRDASGRVDDFRPLVGFLYELARDLVPTGTLEGKIDRIAAHGEPDADGERGPIMFTNGWLARWAQDAAERLAEHVDPSPALEYRDRVIVGLLRRLRDLDVGASPERVYGAWFPADAPPGEVTVELRPIEVGRGDALVVTLAPEVQA